MTKREKEAVGALREVLWELAGSALGADAGQEATALFRSLRNRARAALAKAEALDKGE